MLEVVLPLYNLMVYTPGVSCARESWQQSCASPMGEEASTLGHQWILASEAPVVRASKQPVTG